MKKLVHTTEQDASRRVSTAVQSISIVGLGYVGLPLAILAEERGFRVSGYDTDEGRAASLQKRNAPFISEQELQLFKKSRMAISHDESVLARSDAYIICVPTPVDGDRRPDLRPLIAASESVGRYLRPGNVVVVESSVNPGACEGISLAILERISGLKVEQDFYFAHCPERINPGDTKWDVRSLPRVLGASGPKSLAQAMKLYSVLIDGGVVPMQSIKEAEAVKMVENAFRDVNIAFVNELAMSFAKADIDIVNVIQGASSKPFAFMPHFPGCGVGGHCIPVDPYYLIRYGRENGFEHKFLSTAREINDSMPRYTVDLLEHLLSKTRELPLANATVALLGLAYKRDVPDLRESPALRILEELEGRGAIVQSYDPFADGLSTSRDIDDSLRGADAAIVATDHTMFRTLSPETFLENNVGVVVDGRNCLSKEAFQEAGIAYRGIGR
jgi:UDP-N-acetyl-D-glucosamine dehydrogenase